MNKVIIIGAGQIGRGFIGMELERAGYHVLFADVNHAVIDDLNARGSYTVSVLDAESTINTVTNISAMYASDPKLPEQFADPELSLVCTSVGQTALSKVAGTIARGISLRRQAGIQACMNVIAVENAVGGTTQLKGHIYARMNESDCAYADRFIGFPNSAVDRIIPANAPDARAADVVVERYFEWDVEKKPLKAEIAPVDGLHIVEDLGPYLERKLFTLNGPNAVTACYGWLKGYSTIRDALEDPEIYKVVWGMMEECGAMLEKRHAFPAEEMLRYRTMLMKRFLNPYIIDSVARVAREPIRKLSPADRIIAPMQYALAYGISTPNYYTGIAAVLLYHDPNDSQSVRIRQSMDENGLAETLYGICGIPVESELSRNICREYQRLHGEYLRGGRK